MNRRARTDFVVVALWLVGGLSAAAQSAGRLTVSVADPSRSVIVGAAVSLVRSDTGQAPAAKSQITGADGTTTFDDLAPGRYTIRAEFPGFETVEVRDHRVGNGLSRRAITLPIKKVAEDLTVGRDRQEMALDPGGSAFSTILTREQIDALPDDPAELEAVLKAMSPPGATIRVDGFTGGRLPSKSQIRTIRLPRMDQFAAENHGGMQGAMFIDISTQPGGGVIGGSVETSLRDDALNAANPFTPEKGDERLRQGSFSIAGPVVSGRSSFSLDFGGGRQTEAGALVAALPDGSRAEPTAPTIRNATFGGRFDQAIGATHTLRASVRGLAIDRANLGVGGFDLPSRGYSTSSRETTLRLSESGAIGRRLFIDSRVEARWVRTTTESAVEAPTVRVLDAFTAGGAQRAGGRRGFEFEAATSLDVVRGQHSVRGGGILEYNRHRVDEHSNYLGTFTFSSLDDYEADRPSLFTRRTGDPLVRYANSQVGLYLQDDYRVARSLLLSYGVRYERQSMGRSWSVVTPRATLSWAPWRSGKTTIRAAWGLFRDWLPESVHEQTLVVDGSRQRETVVSDPDPSADGLTAALPSNRYELANDLTLPATWSWQAGVDHTITASLRLGATFVHRGSTQLPRGFNANAALGGVRPDERFREVFVATSDAAQRSNLVMVNASIARPDWRRLFGGVNYTWASVESNTAGAFAAPASGSLAREWGVVMPRHRLGANLSLRVWSTLAVNVTARAQSGSPYSITTGVDANGDGQFSDRPDGVPRNSLRTAAEWDIGGRVSYAWGFGGPARRGAAGGGEQIVIRMGTRGGLEGGFDGGAENARYRLEFYLSAQNVTNHRNYTGYSGVLTSPFFGQPTNVLNPRKVELGVRLGF